MLTMIEKLVLPFLALALTCAAQQPGFQSPEAAAQELINAAAAHDTRHLANILGPGAAQIMTSGNAEQDRGEQTEFAQLARAKHSVRTSAANSNRAVLSIGDEDWPFPIPIVKIKGQWFFDAGAGSVEMHARRIGTHELDAIEICRGYVDAQRQYASQDRNKDGMLVYAARLDSTPGHRDGLYWQGESQPLVPAEFAQSTAKPYHGYYFRILTGQGPNAPGGAHNYMAKGKLVGGFGLVAWPATYGVTGIHTFIVNQDGIVYQKDLAGPSAIPITRYDPDPTWQPVE